MVFRRILLLLLLMSMQNPGFTQNQTQSGRHPSVGSIDLSEYSLSGGPFKIKSIDNASGIAYSPESKTLFVINDSPQVIVEIEPDGKHRRRIKIKGSHDLTLCGELTRHEYPFAHPPLNTSRLL